MCLIQVVTLSRYVYGPFNETICQIDHLFKNVLAHKGICIVNFALAVRYIFTVHAKNPTAIQDDYWSMFLECWALGKFRSLNIAVFKLQHTWDELKAFDFCPGFAIICQVTTFIFPGKHAMFYYFCIGKMPKSLVGQKTTLNCGWSKNNFKVWLINKCNVIRMWLIKKQL